MKGLQEAFVALQGRRNNAIISRRGTAGGNGSAQPEGATRTSQCRREQSMRANQGIQG
jgi:hypothetical protein